MYNSDDLNIIQEDLEKKELMSVKTEEVLSSQGYLVNESKKCKRATVNILIQCFDNPDCLDDEAKKSLIAQVNNIK